MEVEQGKVGVRFSLNQLPSAITHLQQILTLTFSSPFSFSISHYNSTQSQDAESS